MPKFPLRSPLTAPAQLRYVSSLFRPRAVRHPPAETGTFPPVMTKSPNTPDPPKTFEAALVELESIVATMEGGQLPLAEALTAYKRGAELLHFCQAALKDAEQQVQVLERGVLKAFTPSEPSASTTPSEGASLDEDDAS